MKTEKLNLKSIKNVLSRAEMKKVMAGSGGSGPCTPRLQTCAYRGQDMNFPPCCSGLTCVGDPNGVSASCV